MRISSLARQRPLKSSFDACFSMSEPTIRKSARKKVWLKCIRIWSYFKLKASTRKRRWETSTEEIVRSMVHSRWWRVTFNWPVRGAIRTCHGMSVDSILLNFRSVRIIYGHPMWSWSIQRMANTRETESTMLWSFDTTVGQAALSEFSPNSIGALRSTGYVRFMFQDLWKTICKVRSTYFPFDEQRCTIIIRSGAHDSQSIKFIQRRPIQGHSFIRGEWELVHSYTDITDERVSDFGEVDYSLVRFTLVLKRNHLYYLIKIILPFAMVSFVTLFTFLLPPQTGEKLTLNVTILLSLVIYLQLLSEYIPKSDDETPILTLFCNANFFLVFLSCIMTVYVLYLYHRPSTSHVACVPTYLKIIFIDYLSPLVYCNLNKQEVKKPKSPKKSSPERKPRRLSSIEKRMCHIFAVGPVVESTNEQVRERER